MWLQFFTVVFAIALGLGLGAVALESNEEARTSRNFRHR